MRVNSGARSPPTRAASPAFSRAFRRSKYVAVPILLVLIVLLGVAPIVLWHSRLVSLDSRFSVNPPNAYTQRRHDPESGPNGTSDAELDAARAGIEKARARLARLEESTSRNASVRVRGVQGEVRETVYGGRDGWLQISVLVDGDLAGLMRLCVTLAKGRFNEPVALVFHLNAKQPQAIHDFVVGFVWSNGPKHVQARHTRVAASTMFLEAWYPSGQRDDNEWCLVLGSHVDLSPHYAEWIVAGRRACDADNACVGLSLYSPSVSELTDNEERRSVATRVGHGPAYLAQLPCMVAPVFKSQPWRVFRSWEQHLSSTNGDYAGDLDLGRAAQWPAAWRRHFLELMLVMDWFMMYPLLDGANAAFASPIVGAAIQPLLDHPPTETLLTGVFLPRVDHRHDPVRNVTDALLASTRHLPHRRVSRIDTCAAHNPRAHAAVVQREHGITLVISHLYTRQRFHGFVKKLLQYCLYHEIARIVVVWHFVRLTPPTMGVCGSGGNTTVHFLVPNAADSLNNRFTPTYRVLTDVVVTIDDDIEVTEPDLVRMARILRAQRLQRIVSPYPRWHDVRGNYLWLPTRAEHVGYSLVLTKLHLSPYWMYHAYFCDPTYARQREKVALSFNAEDILFNKVGFDHGVRPLFVVPLSPIVDSGASGLHNRSGHSHTRSEMIRACNFNQTNWVAEVVRSPGDEVTRYTHDDYLSVYKDKLVECGDCLAREVASMDPFGGRSIEVPDPSCLTGIAFGTACCQVECGKCGGNRCDLRRPGASACCGGVIQKAALMCTSHQPPCLLNTTNQGNQG